MGTRNLTSVYWQKKTKVAQYGQWDGYPAGAGLTVLKFLQTVDLKKFKEQLKKVKFLSAQEIKDRWKECGADDSDFVGMDVSDKFKKQYPELHRDTGADILNLIYQGSAFNLWDDHNFADDTLFCEWHYLIDLDKNKLTVYSSGNPVKTYNLNKLPTKKQFLKDLEEKEEE